jgi:hypothetical protein
MPIRPAEATPNHLDNLREFNSEGQRVGFGVERRNTMLFLAFYIDARGSIGSIVDLNCPKTCKDSRSLK